MIKSIRLRNFQAHEDTTINFHNGVNAVTGKTDSGKTACIRALKWVLTNRPSGNSIVNHDAFVDNKQIAPCIVTVVTDKAIVERERSAKVNRYTVNGQVLDTVGTDVPIEVTDALNLDDINIQYQLDMPFLLTETPGEVGRILNKIVKLDDIDNTLRNINSYAKSKTADKKRVEYELKQVTAEIEAVDLEGISALVETGELLEELIGTIGEKCRKIQELVLDINRLTETLAENRLQTSSEALLDDWHKIYLLRKEMHERASIIDTYIRDISAIETRVDKLKELATIETKQIDEQVDQYVQIKQQIVTLDRLVNEIKATQNKLDRSEEIANIETKTIDKLVTKLNKVNTNMDRFDIIYSNVVQLDKNIKNTVEVISKEEKALKEMIGDVCPVCGQKVVK